MQKMLLYTDTATTAKRVRENGKGAAEKQQQSVFGGGAKLLCQWLQAGSLKRGRGSESFTDQTLCSSVTLCHHYYDYGYVPPTHTH